MFKLILAIGLAASFLFLTELRFNENNKNVATLITGAEANSKIFKTPVQFSGTVVEALTQGTGALNINLQADDGNNIKVLVGPTLTIKVPALGERIQVKAHQLDRGIYSVTKSDDIKYLPISWVVSTPLEVIYDFKRIPLMERVNVLGTVNLGSKDYAFLYGPKGTMLRLSIPANVLKKSRMHEWDEVALTGHLDGDRIFIVEEIRPVSKD
jgi:hypothetical protein